MNKKNKYLFIFICMSMLMLNCTNQKKDNSQKAVSKRYPLEIITLYNNFYDSDSRLIKVEIKETGYTVFNGDELPEYQIQEYSYNENGQLIRIETYADNLFTPKSLIEIKNFGNDYTETIKLSDNDTTFYNYEKQILDKHGNIIEMHHKLKDLNNTEGPLIIDDISYLKYNSDNQKVSVTTKDLRTNTISNTAIKYIQNADTLIEVLYENEKTFFSTKTFFNKERGIKYELSFNRNNVLTDTKESHIKENEIYLEVNVRYGDEYMITDSSFYEKGKEMRNIFVIDDSSGINQTNKEYDDKGNIVKEIYFMRFVK